MTKTPEHAEFNHAFGWRLEKLIYGQGRSAESVAKDAGVWSASMCNYIHGNRTPNIYHAAKLATALGTTIDYLAGLTNDPGRPE